MEEQMQNTEETLIHEVLLGNFKITTKLIDDLEKYSQYHSLPLVFKAPITKRYSSDELTQMSVINPKNIIGYIKITDRLYSTNEGGRVTVFGELKLIPTYESLYEETKLALNGFSSPVHLVRLVKSYPTIINNRVKSIEEAHQRILYAWLAEPDDVITSMEDVLEIAKRNDVYDEI